MNISLKIISLLLSYPTAELQQDAPELKAALETDPLTSAREKALLAKLADDIAGLDLYDAQERYVFLFDRTRTLSLHLFEHVHGESRDRGQAMVDLMAMYNRHGFEIGAKELPDYLPLFLEFLSAVPDEQARELLGQTVHIVSALRERLRKRKSIYGNAFRVLEAIRDASPDTQIVFTSSATVYGEGPGVPIREDHPKIPESPYGVSKLACEHYLRLFARLYGLKTATVRLFSVYGPRLRKQVVYDFMCKLRENPDELFIYGDGTQVRDMNHVANVVEALLLISRRAAMEGEVYNVASGEPVTILELAHGLCAAMGLRPEFAFSGEVRPGETQRWVPDPKKLFDLGYRNRVSLAEGLADTASWFLEEEPRSIRD